MGDAGDRLELIFLSTKVSPRRSLVVEGNAVYDQAQRDMPWLSRFFVIKGQTSHTGTFGYHEIDGTRRDRTKSFRLQHFNAFSKGEKMSGPGRLYRVFSMRECGLIEHAPGAGIGFGRIFGRASEGSPSLTWL